VPAKTGTVDDWAATRYDSFTGAPIP
jgi:hypothetical protein